MNEKSGSNVDIHGLEKIHDLSNYHEIVDSEEICDLKIYKGIVPDDEPIKEFKVDSKINIDRDRDGEIKKEFKIIGKLVNKLIIENENGKGAIGIILIHKVIITLTNSPNEPYIENNEEIKD